MAYLDNTGLAYFFNKLKTIFATKDVATTSTAGLMSATDKAKLDGISPGGDISFYRKLESTYTATGSVTTIPIGISDFSSADMLLVDINGLDLTPSEYTVSGTNIVLANSITSGNVVHFTALRAVSASSQDYSALKGDPGDDGLGVPSGGAAGQLLVKQSAANNDTAWQTYCPFPVGYVMQMTNGNNPNTLYPGTTWTAINGVFLLASSSSYALGNTGGSADAVVVKHNHTQNPHSHGVTGGGVTGTTVNSPYTYLVAGYSGSANPIYMPFTIDNATATNQETGVDGAGKNMPPYKVVNMWERTA